MSRIHDAVQRAAENQNPAVAEIETSPTFDIKSFPAEQRVPVVPSPTVPKVRRKVDVPPVTETPSSTPFPLLVRPNEAPHTSSPDRKHNAALGYYRRLAATLIQAKPEGKALTLLVTSADAGEGKTTTAANIALTFARAFSRRVLLVDADMRRPNLHNFFGTTNHGGMGECLLAGRLISDAPVLVEPRLALLTSGHPATDPVSYLSNPTFREFLEQVSLQFDVVIFDSPPAGLLPDAELIAAATQGTLLVVQAASTAYDKVERAVESLGRERILGVVLNRATADADPAGYYAGGYEYDTPAAGRRA